MEPKREEGRGSYPHIHKPTIRHLGAREEATLYTGTLTSGAESETIPVWKPL